MRISKFIVTADSHTEGMPTRVIVSGVPKLPGRSMAEKRDYFMKNLDYIRKMLSLEPRGHSAMHCAVITDPTVPEADVGVLFMYSEGYGDMCGHGTIGVVTTLLELGMIKAEEPVTEVVLDTPAGLVKARALVRGGKVVSVTLRNMPSFTVARGVTVDVPGAEGVRVDVAYGGNYFALVSAEDLGVGLQPSNLRKLVELGWLVWNEVSNKVKLSNPLNPSVLPHVTGTVIYIEASGGSHFRSIAVDGRNRFDRSPCGTGTSCLLALLYDTGKLRMGDEIVNESIIGTKFRGKIVEEVTVGGLKAIIPEITGRAWITGIHHFVRDPEDPLKDGFMV